jgi:hypothetical protein
MLEIIILSFWGAWFSLAFLSNASDTISALGIISQPWVFHSSNFYLVQHTVGIYQWSSHIALTIFIINTVAQGIIASLFIIALFKRVTSTIPRECLAWPLYLNVALWAGFLIVEEFFLAYGMEATHQRLLMLALLSVLLLKNKLDE